MNLIISYILTILTVVTISSAHEEHPFGHSITFQISENLSNLNHEKLRKIFGHPEVENRKVVILSIIGAYRKGKSFFLDYCLRYLYANYRSINTINNNFVKRNKWWGEDDEPLTGFSWKHGSEPDTKGILFWSDVFLHEQNGEKIAIFLIDTQGLFESGRDSNLDAKIFGITNFVSSIQIFNIRDVIQEDQLEHLKTVTDFSKLTAKRQKEKSLSSNFKPFQSLLFLFRDWEIDDMDYGYNGGQIYLNRFLDVTNANEKAQNVRNNIRESYDSIRAYLLPPPGRIVKKSHFDGRWGPLDDEFKEYFIPLIESIFAPQNLIKKKIFGKEVTAHELCNYVISIFSAFEGSNLPENDSIFDLAINIELKELSTKMVNEYSTKLLSTFYYKNFNYAAQIFDDHYRVQTEVIEKYKKIPKMADEAKFIEITKAAINNKLYDLKGRLEQMYWEWIARREEARRIYYKTPIYIACKIASFGMHDCGMTNNVNSIN